MKSVKEMFAPIENAIKNSDFKFDNRLLVDERLQLIIDVYDNPKLIKDLIDYLSSRWWKPKVLRSCSMTSRPLAIEGIWICSINWSKLVKVKL